MTNEFLTCYALDGAFSYLKHSLINFLWVFIVLMILAVFLSLKTNTSNTWKKYLDIVATIKTAINF